MARRTRGYWHWLQTRARSRRVDACRRTARADSRSRVRQVRALSATAAPPPAASPPLRPASPGPVRRSGWRFARAAAGLAEQRQHLAGANVEIETVHRAVGRLRARLAKFLGDVVEVNGRLDRRDGVSHIARSETAR